MTSMRHLTPRCSCLSAEAGPVSTASPVSHDQQTKGGGVRVPFYLIYAHLHLLKWAP